MSTTAPMTRRLPQLYLDHIGVIAFGAGMFALLTGTVAPDERLYAAYVPLSPFLFACMAIVVFALPISRRALFLILLAHALLIPYASTSVGSWDPEYGAWKAINLICCSLTITISFGFLIERHGLDVFLKAILATLSVLFAAALAYKLVNGFFDRSVSFLMNGPIVFGRLMGVGAIFSYFCLSGIRRDLAVAAFLFGVVWTFSNGPTAAILCCLFLLYVILGNWKDRGKALLAIAGLAAAFLLAESYLGLDIQLGRLALIVELVTNGSSALQSGGEFASASSRATIFAETLRLIERQPLGVGAGGWAGEISSGSLAYPHNLILEALSEGGLVVGVIALVPFVAFVFSRCAPLFITCIFLFLSQQVSGDLLDARYLLSFSLLSVIAYPATERFSRRSA